MRDVAAPVLVTGAAGFIGRHLVESLLAAGVSTRALLLPDEPIPDACVTRWAEARDAGLLTIVRGDVTDPASLEPACDGVATTFHLAAVVGDWGRESLFQRVTVGGTESLLLAIAAGSRDARVVLASSIVVYGDRLGRQTCDESTPFGRALGPYSRAKQAQERLARELAPRLGLKLAVVRPANVYGVGSRPWVEMVAPLLRTRQITLIDGGTFDAGLVHVRNLVDLMLRAAVHLGTLGPATEDEPPIYNAADGFGVTWRRYFGDLADALGAPPPRSAPRLVATQAARAFELLFRLTRRSTRPPLTREALNLAGSHHRLPTERARRELGWAPTVSYDEAIAELRSVLSR